MKYTKKVVIMDGQGGKIGSLLIEKLKLAKKNFEIYAIGTNSIATASMLKAGADFGATGENPVAVNCANADVIAGPIGIISANSLIGELTPEMAISVGKSRTKKILLPVARCNIYVVGVKELSIQELIELAVGEILAELDKN